MSPYPAQTNRDAIVQVAGEIIEAQGVEHLSLGKVAEALGIKTPSLYHHIRDKDDLLRAVNDRTMRDFLTTLRHAAEDAAGDDPRAALRAMLQAYRDYADAHPVLYHLLFSGNEAILPPVEDTLPLVMALQERTAALTGPEQALSALRGLWALAHGFVTLERAGQFRRGERVEDSWRRVVDAYLAGWRSGETS